MSYAVSGLVKRYNPGEGYPSHPLVRLLRKRETGPYLLTSRTMSILQRMSGCWRSGFERTCRRQSRLGLELELHGLLNPLEFQLQSGAETPAKRPREIAQGRLSVRIRDCARIIQQNAVASAITSGGSGVFTVEEW